MLVSPLNRVTDSSCVKMVLKRLYFIIALEGNRAFAVRQKGGVLYEH